MTTSMTNLPSTIGNAMTKSTKMSFYTKQWIGNDIRYPCFLTLGIFFFWHVTHSSMKALIILAIPFHQNVCCTLFVVHSIPAYPPFDEPWNSFNIPESTVSLPVRQSSLDMTVGLPGVSSQLILHYLTTIIGDCLPTLDYDHTLS